jgi:putative tryptophan/tyrosine transport system ATP-binding protein
MIRVEQVRKDFRSIKGAGFLLEDITFDIPERSVVAILGTNGSGKSTILKILAGELEPDGGQIICNKANDGTNSFHSLKRLYLDQHSGNDLVPTMTIRENLLLAQITHSVGSLRFPNTGDNKSAAINALNSISLGLDTRMNEQVRFLSGGEKQGLVLARAILYRSEMLLLDEFVSALAHNLAAAAIEIVQKLAHTVGTYCVLVTHEIDLAFRFADQLLFMHNGRLMANLSNTPTSQKQIIDLYSHCLAEFIINGTSSSNYSK